MELEGKGGRWEMEGKGGRWEMEGKGGEEKSSYNMYLLTWRSLHQYGEGCSHH